MTPCLLALDFGGTKHSAACLVSGETSWRAHRRAYARSEADAPQDLEVMFKLAREVLAGHSPQAVGVSFGGPVDFSRGLVRLSHHVPGWENIPLADLVTAEFNAPTLVDNDANAAGLGEALFGAGRGMPSLFYITVSTGVGGGWILDGKVWRGHESMAGEIGHTLVDPLGPQCLCGKRGCVERLASGPYLAQDMRAILRKRPDAGPILRNLIEHDLDRIDGAVIAEAAAGGDREAQELISRAGRAVGTGIGNAANLINPHCFILGGGVTKAGPIFWDALKVNARRTALPEIHFKILQAKLGDDAPLWGAARLAALAANG